MIIGGGIAGVLQVSSDPDGTLTAQRGTLAINSSTGEIYQNSDGATAWKTMLLGVPRWGSGLYYMLGAGTLTATTATINNQMRASPFPVPNRVTLTRLGAEVTVIGDVGSKVRLGIYADNGSGRPGSLVVDAGQIAGDSATVQELTISAALNPGTYWAAWAVQSAPGTVPTLRAYSTPGPFYLVDGSTSAPTAGGQFIGFSAASVSGALPATYTVSGQSGLGTRLFGKTA